jgi:hypothetical protein
MSIITVAMPAGLYMNGTPYEQKQRWNDGSRVRWHNGALRPIGGWERAKTDAGVNYAPLSSNMSVSVYRDAFSWVSSANSRHYVFGANDAIKILLPSQVLTDITPAGFVGSPPEPTINIGYGSWLYGFSSYGTPRPIIASQEGRLWRWKFDTWGEDLIAGPNDPKYRGSLYVWDTSAGPAQMIVIAGAPTDIGSYVVTDQRIIMAIASDTEARIVRWCDRENYSDWVATQLNYAGSYFLQGNGQLLSIHKVLNQILILSETDAHVARFIGAPLVYGFDRVGDDCGPWSGPAVYVADRFAIWPGRRTFWMYDGTLKPLECDIMDFLDIDVDRSKLSKCFCLGVPQFNEVWWFYEAIDNATSNPTKYFTYNYLEGTWSKGTLERSAGLSGEVYLDPYMVSSDTQAIHVHELPSVLTPDTTVTSGALELGEGEVNMAVRYIYPDTANKGDVIYNFETRDMPTSDPVLNGPYTNEHNPISTRVMGREIRMNLQGAGSVGWRVGSKTRFDVAPVGVGNR